MYKIKFEIDPHHKNGEESIGVAKIGQNMLCTREKRFLRICLCENKLYFYLT